MAVQVYAVDRSDVAPLAMSDRFRHEVTYFMSLPGEPGVPLLGPNQYWIDRENARSWLADGVFHLVSPLDSENKTEVELSEEHETFFEWLAANEIERIELR
jgi:hypothetical protein